jgi:hypothetical protein
VIELDGDSHAETVEYDARRTEKLKKRGYRVLRFFNDEVQNNLDGVVEAIWQAVQTPPPLPSPVSNNGGGDEKLSPSLELGHDGFMHPAQRAQ